MCVYCRYLILLIYFSIFYLPAICSIFYLPACFIFANLSMSTYFTVNIKHTGGSRSRTGPQSGALCGTVCGLTHLSLVIQSRALRSTVCALSIAIILYSIDQLLACWFYLYYLVMFFCILVDDYTLCFIGSPCLSVLLQLHICIWPYNSYSHANHQKLS